MPPTSNHVAPRLSAFDASMIVVSLVIGIGIFRTPALVARATAGPLSFLAAWAIGAVVSLAGALTFAEIGSRYPRAGGYYKVVAHCWHPMAAFLLNWAQVLMQGAGAAGVAYIGAEYLLRLAGRDGELAATLVAFALIAGLLVLNAAGVRAGARAQNVLSLGKIALIAGLAAAGSLLAPAGPPATAVSGPPPAGMLAALVAVFYAFGGYQNTINLAGDVKDAPRRLPLAVVSGMAIVAALYLGINVAYARALGFDALRESPLVAADLSRRVFGQAGEAFVSLAIFLSAAGFVNATILHVPRSYLAMAGDGLLPPILGRVHAKTQAQPAGLAAFALTALVPLGFLRSFDKLLGYVMFTDALSLVAVASCVFVLRRRGEGDGAGATYRLPGYPWVPAAFVACLLGIAANVLVRQTAMALAGVAVVAAGVPLYLWTHRRWGGI